MEIEKENMRDTNEISLKEIILRSQQWFRHILSKWVIILVCGILGAGLGFLYATTRPLIFTATTTFVLEDSGSGGGLGQYAGLASMAGIDLPGGAASGDIFHGNNILELYKSRTMIEKTLFSPCIYKGKKELLIDRYVDFNNLRKIWDKKPALKGFKFKTDRNLEADPEGSSLRLQDSIVSAIIVDINKNYLKVAKPDELLSIIKAEVKAPDEFFAKNFNDQIVKNVNDFYVQTKTKKALQNVKILQIKTDSVRAVMNGAIYSSVLVSDATPNLNVTRQVQRMAPMQRSQFNAETNKTVLAELLKNLEISKMGLLKETPLIQVVDYPVYPLNKQKLGKIVGTILGGFIAGVITVMIILLIRMIKHIMI